MNKKLVAARREVERLKLEAAGAGQPDVAVWEAGHAVSDLEQKEREAAVRTARRAALVMDVALTVVAVLVMAFSLGNVHDFAIRAGVGDPIAYFLAPAVDLALLAALLGDAVLSRHQLAAGPWARALRWYAGGATLALNAWESVTGLHLSGIVLHASMPILLFILGEAASPYRERFAETVKLAAARVDTPAPTVAPTVVDTAPVSIPEPVADGVYDQEADRAVSTMTPQVERPGTTVPVPAVGGADEADTPTERLSADAAKRAIEQAWKNGMSVREAAVVSTRSPSYVGGVYARLTRARGDQPLRGQTEIEIPDETGGMAA